MEEAVEKTVEWSKIYFAKGDIPACMDRQIKEFFENEVVRMILLIFEEYQRTLAFQKNTSYP